MSVGRALAYNEKSIHYGHFGRNGSIFTKIWRSPNPLRRLACAVHKHFFVVRQKNTLAYVLTYAVEMLSKFAKPLMPACKRKA